MSISERLKALVDIEGSLAKFSKKTGIKRSSLSNAVIRGSGLRSQTIDAIAETYPNLNIRWLIRGEEPMWLDDKTIQEENEKLMAENAKLKEEVLQLMEDRKLDKDQIKKLWDLVEEYRGKR